jgi:hypothetical protein
MSAHHALGQEGWEEVADYALDWLGEHGVAETIGKATGIDADTVR